MHLSLMWCLHAHHTTTMGHGQGTEPQSSGLSSSWHPCVQDHSACPSIFGLLVLVVSIFNSDFILALLPLTFSPLSIFHVLDASQPFVLESCGEFHLGAVLCIHMYIQRRVAGQHKKGNLHQTSTYPSIALQTQRAS